MTSYTHELPDGAIPFADEDAPRHSVDDAIPARTFERLLAASHRLDDYRGLQTRFILIAGGRLGLRPGEIAHIRESWVDWRNARIHIPAHEPCRKGRDGGVCGYCRQLAGKRIDVREGAVTLEEAVQARWHAKTENAVRLVPFDWNERVALTVEDFFDAYDAFPVSKSGLQRRLYAAVDMVPGFDRDDTAVTLADLQRARQQR